MPHYKAGLGQCKSRYLSCCKYRFSRCLPVASTADNLIVPGLFPAPSSICCVSRTCSHPAPAEPPTTRLNEMEQHQSEAMKSRSLSTSSGDKLVRKSSDAQASPRRIGYSACCLFFRRLLDRKQITTCGGGPGNLHERCSMLRYISLLDSAP